jgi:hypothetical protein
VWFVQCSDLFLKVTGYERSEVLEGSIFGLTPPEELPKTYEIFSDMMKEIQGASCTFGTHKDEEDRVVSARNVATEAELVTSSGRAVRRRVTGDSGDMGGRCRPDDCHSAFPATNPSVGQKRAHAQITPIERSKAAQAIIHSLATPPSTPMVSRAFNKACKMKHGLALVHVRMSMICDEDSGAPKYILCTILPLAAPQYSAPVSAMPYAQNNSLVFDASTVSAKLPIDDRAAAAPPRLAPMEHSQEFAHTERSLSGGVPRTSSFELERDISSENLHHVLSPGRPGPPADARIGDHGYPELALPLDSSMHPDERYAALSPNIFEGDSAFVARYPFDSIQQALAPEDYPNEFLEGVASMLKNTSVHGSS